MRLLLPVILCGLICSSIPAALAGDEESVESPVFKKKEKTPWWKIARQKEKDAKAKVTAEASTGSKKSGSSSSSSSSSKSLPSLLSSKKKKDKKSSSHSHSSSHSSSSHHSSKSSSGAATVHPPPSASHDFPRWACTPERIQKSSKVIRTKNTNMKDLDGKPIHAHGGGFLAPLQGGGGHKRWWWYGESAKGKPQNAGVNAYSSGDLLHWKFEGVMISQRTILGKLRQLKTNSAFAAIRSNASATVIVERPKVVYCPKTSRYVMYFHLDHRQERRPHYHWRLVAVATAEHPNGPFHLHHAFHPSGLPSLDISLYQLPADDGHGNVAHEAFLVRAIDNKYIGASKLRDDFLDVEDPTVSILTSGRREAPTLFRSNGVYRLLVTETEGWNPSRLHLLNGTHGLKQLPANAATAGSRRNGRLGMAKLPPAFTEAKSPTPPAVKGAFDSQIAAVIQHCDGKGRPYYIYVADRWNVGPGRTGIEHAGYVWLPLSTPVGKPVSLQWRQAWDLFDPWNVGTV